MFVMLKICSILALNLLSCSPLTAVEDYPVGDTPCRRYVAEGRDGQRITFCLFNSAGTQSSLGDNARGPL